MSALELFEKCAEYCQTSWEGNINGKKFPEFFSLFSDYKRCAAKIAITHVQGLEINALRVSSNMNPRE